MLQTKPWMMSWLARWIAARRTVCGAGLAIAFVGGSFTSTAEATVLHVPGDFPTIQACINAAVPGDECVVAPGTYNELIDFNGKAITLRSSDGPELTIIDAGPVANPGTGKPVIRLEAGEGPNTVLDGFTITGGTGASCFINEITCGGGMYLDGASPTLIHCTFLGNTASAGGGMYNLNSSPTVTNCTFTENATSNGGGGGILNVSNSSPTVTQCIFSGNTGLNGGGGIFNADNSNPTVTNCIFSGNFAFEGGGMFSWFNSAPTVTNCTFSGNSGGAGGGAIFSTDDVFGGHTTPTISNCILWGNHQNEILDVAGAVTTVGYSDVQGSWPGPGNIDTDPLFTDAAPGTADDNLRLLPGSPCIDAGSNEDVPPDGGDLDGDGDTLEPIPFDVEGNSRFVDDPDSMDTGVGTPPIVDMGSFEFQATCGDGVVDPGEQCDDMGESATCDINCTLAECGDGTHNASAGEACDDAGESADCNSDCTLAECGDGIVNATAGEQCDIGPDVFGDCCAPDCQFEGTGSFCGQGPVECSDQDTCDGGGNCTLNDLPLGSPCGAPADMPGSCFTGDACSGGGVCLPGSIVTVCIDDDLCCNRMHGCSAENDNDCEQNIPTVSTWGLLVLALMLAAAAKVQFGHRPPVEVPLITR